MFKSSRNQFLVLLFATSVFFVFAAVDFQSRRNLRSYFGDYNLMKITPTPQLEDRSVTVILTGDVMLGRTVMTTSLDKKDPTYPFRKVVSLLESADLVFINLENPIVKNCPRIESGYSFCADPKMVSGLVTAGIDVANLANNHSRNFGSKGFDETIKYLDLNNIGSTGYGNLVILDKKGISFGFLGFDFFSKEPTEEDFALIKQSNGKVDVLIIGVHWGIEYTSKPTEAQREWAKRMVEEGVDAISGHHPHWVQSIDYFSPQGANTNPPLGWIDTKPVYYSLGNFVFDQMWSEETKKGLVIKLTFDEGRIVNEEKFDTYIKERGQPEIVVGSQ